MLTLISGTPSPFARIVRIALHEKGIEFTLQNEVSWNSTTQTPLYNPLEKLPILLFDDGRAPVYDSAHIVEYIVQKYADKGPRLLTGNLDLDLYCRQILVLAEGMLDAFVLLYFEKSRVQPSAPWTARQDRKIDGALRAFDELVKKRQPSDTDFLIGDVLTIADIGVVCAVDMVNYGDIRPQWKDQYPELARWISKMDQRVNFRDTKPITFEIKDKIV